jgi:carbon storage regulator
MLVLTRKPQETIRIGDEICITIVSIEGGVAKIGIEAPTHVPVHRGEVYQRILEENRLAAHSQPGSLPAIARCWNSQRSRLAAHSAPLRAALSNCRRAAPDTRKREDLGHRD